MSCSGSSGYLGYLKVCSGILPYLNADLTRIVEIIPSNSIHGGGVGNTNPVFRSQHNFSIGRRTTEGSVTVEVFGGSGNYATAFSNFLQRAIPTASDQSTVCNGFDSSCKLIFSPGGGYEISLPGTGAAQGKALISQFDLRGNPGGNVEATARIVSAGDDYNGASANAPAASALAFETAGASDDSNPVPYYASNFTVTGSGESNLADRIMDWSISVNNNANPIFTFNGESFAQDILLGMQEVTGTFSYYAADGVFVEQLTHGATLTITFGSITINCPFIAFGPSPIPSPGPNAPTVRNVQFRAFAASSSAPAIYYS